MLRAAVCLFFAELLFGLTLCDDLGYICSFMYKMEWRGKKLYVLMYVVEQSRFFHKNPFSIILMIFSKKFQMMNDL